MFSLTVSYADNCRDTTATDTSLFAISRHMRSDRSCRVSKESRPTKESAEHHRHVMFQIRSQVRHLRSHAIVNVLKQLWREAESELVRDYVLDILANLSVDITHRQPFVRLGDSFVYTIPIPKLQCAPGVMCNYSTCEVGSNSIRENIRSTSTPAYLVK